MTELGTEKDLNPKPDENVIVVKCVESADPVKPIGKKELLILLTCNSFIMGRLLVVSCLVPQEGTENYWTKYWFVYISLYDTFVITIKWFTLGGSPGLVVMGGDSRSKGHEFESRRRILDGHDIFSH